MSAMSEASAVRPEVAAVSETEGEVGAAATEFELCECFLGCVTGVTGVACTIVALGRNVSRYIVSKRIKGSRVFFTSARIFSRNKIRKETSTRISKVRIQHPL